MLYENLDQEVSAREDWSLRRRKGIPNNKRLFVLTCMDERIPIEQILGIGLGDAHVFRNAGAQVTDDVIRSAALTTNFFGTNEIIVVLHTECGMLLKTGQELAAGLEEKVRERGGDLSRTPLDPALPGLRVAQKELPGWIKAFTDVDESTLLQIELLEKSDLIPDDVKIHGYVYEVESGRLRRPRGRVGEVVSTSPNGRSSLV